MQSKNKNNSFTHTCQHSQTSLETADSIYKPTKTKHNSLKANQSKTDKYKQKATTKQHANNALATSKLVQTSTHKKKTKTKPNPKVKSTSKKQTIKTIKTNEKQTK